MEWSGKAHTCQEQSQDSPNPRNARQMLLNESAGDCALIAGVARRAFCMRAPADDEAARATHGSRLVHSSRSEGGGCEREDNAYDQGYLQVAGA